MKKSDNRNTEPLGRVIRAIILLGLIASACPASAITSGEHQLRSSSDHIRSDVAALNQVVASVGGFDGQVAATLVDRGMVIMSRISGILELTAMINAVEPHDPALMQKCDQSVI